MRSFPQPGDRFNSQLGNFAPGQPVDRLHQYRHVAQIQDTATKVAAGQLVHCEPGFWLSA
jgi:hypothetical protein